ncbi:hypothetical protein [Acinetobacter sp. ANC 3813]|uniref:hypothetical protein n=1 Tax=Acinetobacter sp. ANC 3813 TaxID=1977873 RepID=UPI000A32C4E0|nr:hypothetical protein [Acinetobacter sp. ANC 3813]OTG87861.1 hypothetical protein B9T34_16120 [Acinetobacter sp. ANC 3813]
MPNITEILANESGLQYSGVEDASSKTGSYPNIGAITGVFKRGCYNKPMTITKANQRAMLGYDPENPAYAAIADALDAGLPSVQVLRIKAGVELICQNFEFASIYVRLTPVPPISLAKLLADAKNKILNVSISRDAQGPWETVNYTVNNETPAGTVSFTIQSNNEFNYVRVCAPYQVDLYAV